MADQGEPSNGGDNPAAWQLLPDGPAQDDGFTRPGHLDGQPQGQCRTGHTGEKRKLRRSNKQYVDKFNFFNDFTLFSVN